MALWIFYSVVEESSLEPDSTPHFAEGKMGMQENVIARWMFRMAVLRGLFLLDLNYVVVQRQRH